MTIFLDSSLLICFADCDYGFFNFSDSGFHYRKSKEQTNIYSFIYLNEKKSVKNYFLLLYILILLSSTEWLLFLFFTNVFSSS